MRRLFLALLTPLLLAALPNPDDMTEENFDAWLAAEVPIGCLDYIPQQSLCQRADLNGDGRVGIPDWTLAYTATEPGEIDALRALIIIYFGQRCHGAF